MNIDKSLADNTVTS